MKIIIFTENSRAGGMDSFIKLLIQMWPDRSDDFMLICGHEMLKKAKKCRSY